MALPQNHSELSNKQQAALGLPEGFKLYGPFPFGGMNQQASRQGMEENEFFLLENFIKIGDGKLRTVWDKGTEVYTVPFGKTIVYFYFFNIGETDYVAVFLNDGTAQQYNFSTAVVTDISTLANTFYDGGQLPVCGQWGTKYLLIANNITRNSYWIWDNDTLFSSGGLAPQVDITNSGSGYTSSPMITAYGGSGTGATFTSTVAGGGVVNIHVQNPGAGYSPGDQVQLAFSGGGSDSSAILQAVLTAGNIASVVVTNGGVSYTSSPTISFTGGGGSGATADATVVSGVITAINVTNPGAGYTSTPSVVITDGSGSGATAVASLSPGGVASITVVNGGLGYTGTPALTIVGGGGTGATAVATIATFGIISGVTVTAPGTGYTSPPTVIVQADANRAASATVTLMPFGVSGSSLETFQQRVWLGFPNQQGQEENGGTFLVSAPGSVTDFATSDGGLIFTSTDSFLKKQYVNIKQSNGYLYPMGDSSISVISNVQTSGVPSTTSFNYQNTDPQIGVTWRDSCQDYSRTILFANPFGIFGLYGGSVTKISGKIDDIFNNAVFPPTVGALTPVSSTCNLFNQKVYILLMTIKDPVTLALRNVMVGWDEKEWYLFSQNAALTFINSQEIGSDITAWGTEGTKLFPLFSTPSTAISKRISTKLYGANNAIIMKQAMAFYMQAQDLSTDASGVSLNSATCDSEIGAFDMPNAVNFTSAPPSFNFYGTTSGDIVGVNLGLTISSNSKDFMLTWLGLGYIDVSSVFGNTPIAGTDME